MHAGSGRAGPSGTRSDLAGDVIAEFLLATSLFRDCGEGVVRQIAPHASAYDFKSGAAIVRAGSSDIGIGLVFAGRVAIRKVDAATGDSTVLEDLGMGDHFGEVGALLGNAHIHEARAEEDSTVILFGRDVTTQLATKVAAFSHALAKRVSSRLVKMSVMSLRAAPSLTSSVGKALDPAGFLTLEPSAGAPAAPESGSSVREGNFEFVQVSAYQLDDSLLQMVPVRTMRQHRCLPLELRGQKLTVGLVDPYSVGAINELRRVLSSADPHVVAIGLDDFNETFVRLKLDRGVGKAVSPHEQTGPGQIVYDVIDQEREADKAVRVIGDEVVTLASRIIAHGIDTGASDIHIESDPSGVRVRYRTSGTLIDWDQYVAPSFAKGLVARFKVLAGLDITERRLPQDGRIGAKIGRREIDLRVSTLPASRGEKLVLRLFEAANMMRPLPQIFLEPNTLHAVRDALNRPYGAVIVAGPTGSGKSSTLYACLNERKRNRPDTNIIMVEDPIEFRLGGVTQVQVNHAIDLDFAKVLRAMLRQDPDVIMVGEIRDTETSELALEAAMTGHLLFSSLHANNATAAIQRFENLGCNRTMVAQSMALILIQRLTRRLCARCTTKDVPPPVLLESLARRGLADPKAPIPMPRAVGCVECNNTGFTGRVAMLESMVFTDEVRHALMADKPLGEVEAIALESGALVPFRRYAAYLLTRGLIAPSDALLSLAG